MRAEVSNIPIKKVQEINEQLDKAEAEQVAGDVTPMQIKKKTCTTPATKLPIFLNLYLDTENMLSHRAEGSFLLDIWG